ncbi:MAG: hypothetical protein ACRC6F_07160, partial [Aeromonas sp.]
LCKTGCVQNEKVHLAKDQSQFSQTLILRAGRVRNMCFALKTAFSVKLAVCIVKKCIWQRIRVSFYKRSF